MKLLIKERELDAKVPSHSDHRQLCASHTCGDLVGAEGDLLRDASAHRHVEVGQQLHLRLVVFILGRC